MIQAHWPPNSRNHKIVDKSIPPRVTRRIIDLIRSVIKSLGVVLLNPNFSSITKVVYRVKGRDITNFKNIRIPVKKRPEIMELKSNDLTNESIIWNPPENQNKRIITRSTLDVINPNFVFAFR